MNEDTKNGCFRYVETRKNNALPPLICIRMARHLADSLLEERPEGETFSRTSSLKSLLALCTSTGNRTRIKGLGNLRSIH